jgi:hypothetical protein
MPKVYNRKGILKIEEVLPFVNSENGTNKKILLGVEISLGGKRIRSFKVNGIKCQHCGLVGEYFAVEQCSTTQQSNNKWHLNLYAIKNGHEVMMTRDHVFPLGSGGSNKIINSQTLCSPCNQKKGSKLIDVKIERFNGTTNIGDCTRDEKYKTIRINS